MTRPIDIIDFWMAAGKEKWFAKDAAFDAELLRRFGADIEAAIAGELDAWARTREGRLALILLLDQMTRNTRRGSADAFAGDAKALNLARRALALGDFEALPKEQAQWLLLPFEHHEGMDEQDIAVSLAERLGDADLIKYAIVHRDIIRDFGRFPHRNRLLGRQSTEAELEFLAEGGFAG